MTKQIQKPITVARNDFIVSLSELIKNSQLPMFVIEDVLNGFYRDAKTIAAQNLKNDMEKYMAELSANNKDD